MKTYSVLFIVVLYQTRLEVSETYRALKRVLTPEQLRDNVYVRDNSVENLFLAIPYNIGYYRAKAEGKRWIVLLDQDTVLTDEYIRMVLAISDTDEPKVYVPLLRYNEIPAVPLLVPEKMGFLFAYPYNKRSIKALLPHKYLNMCNSGMIINTQVLDRLGGFDEKNFPFIALDWWFCLMCYRKHIPLEVLKNTPMHQNFSHLLPHYDGLKVGRVRVLIDLYSSQYLCHLMGGIPLVLFKLRLMARIVKRVVCRAPYVHEMLLTLVGRWTLDKIPEVASLPSSKDLYQRAIL